MKTLNYRWYFAALALATSMTFAACKTTNNEEPSPQNEAKSLKINNLTTSLSDRTSTSSPYLVSLDTIIDNNDGTWTYTWSAQNPNPGDGTNGTIVDMSHLGIGLGSFATSYDIVSGSTSTDGRNFIDFNPYYRIDPSQSCYTDPVVVFNLGTRDSLVSYYRLTVNKHFSISDSVSAVYTTSTRTTDCGVFQFSGFAAPIIDESSCSVKPGTYFAKPDYVWRSTVTIGGFIYTQSEAKAIFETSNKGGMRDSKIGFIYLVTLKLSESTISRNATVWTDASIVENYLSRLGKLSASNLPTGNNEARDAASRIGTWLDTHLCSN
ncbi:MAG: hypothetical protein ACKOW2_08995 [Sphingobacteriaceae bacterium]